MPTLPGQSGLQKYLNIKVILAIFIGLAIFRAAMLLSSIPDALSNSDNDDLMRLVVVRDWLGGQGWFDYRQYRILPPEGISLHWSRYIDAAIGGIISFAALFVTMPVAEIIGLAAWPTLLLCLMMLANGIGAQRISGMAAALGALLVLYLWPRIAEFEFAVRRIDHHNLQILCVTLLIFALAWPSRTARAAVIAPIAGGLAAAASFTIGLEMLPVLLILWAIAGLRFAFGYSGAGRWLLIFALTLGIAAPLLMAGQVPVAAWAIRYCDALAPPALSLIAAGIVVSVLPVLLADRVRQPLPRIALMSALLAAGFALAWPLLGPCLVGPYGDVHPEALEVITQRISETQSALTLAKARPASFDFVFLYAWLLLPLVSLAAFAARRRLAPGEGVALIATLVVGWIGVIGSMSQIRYFTLGAAAIPFLTGFALKEMVLLYQRGGKRRAALAVVAGAALLAYPVQVMAPVRDAIARLAGTVEDEAPPEKGLNCRNEESLSELHGLPKSIMATTLNLGVPVLLYTDHSATAAPYHRSGDAFRNGENSYRNEADMLAMLQRSHADYVILCRADDYAAAGMTFALDLLKGAHPDWLQAIDPAGKGAESRLLVYKVLRPLPEAPAGAAE